ncbi:hypothetical protein [Fusibacter ferrireducens]|uniref:Uncharacterized protein n=1 Tax=Fusibacter ferrireducens TaxID=2785058 RepID=A0ABR9ZVA5_9FIRM|nr:hypothetical protein [Fusibacter ferrireducens]MBF4694296.1 hypothetical protein [Fusibacter ferrireducens]
MKKIQKKILSLIMSFTLMLTVLSPSFADSKEIRHDKNGEVYSVNVVIDNSNEKVTIVEYNGTVSKSVLNKKTNVLSLYSLGKGNTTNSLRGPALSKMTDNLIIRVDLNEQRSNDSVRSYTVSDSYNSNYFAYSFAYSGAYTMLQFKLTIPGESLTTPYINSSNRAYGDAFDFKRCVKNADSYLEHTMASCGGLNQQVAAWGAVSGLINSLSDGHINRYELFGLVVSALEAIPGAGSFFSAAEITSYGSLSATELFNARTEFHNVQKYMN